MNMAITPAEEQDAEAISALLAPYAARQIVLPRTPDDIRRHIQNFLVMKEAEVLRGCVALRDFGDGLQEIRSLAVADGHAGGGLGSRLIQAALDFARQRQARQVFALTLRPNLFLRQGFTLAQKEEFPQKIWADCQACRKKECCDEIAVRRFLS